MAEAPKTTLSVPTGAETLHGIGIILVAYIVITGADAAVKWALPEVGAAMAMIWRGVVGGITVVILTRGRGLFPNNRRLLAWRGLLHCCVSATWYWAWARGMPLVDSYAVACATPLLMTLFAIPLLGEKVGWRRWTSTMIGFGGVLIMLQPSGDLWRIEAAALLGAVVLMSVTRIWTRMLSVSDGPAAIAFWLMMAHIPMGLLFLPAFPPPSAMPSTQAMLFLVMFGMFNGMAHLLFARAFALAPVAVLAPFEYSPLLIGGVIGFLIWSEVPGWTTLAGASLVVAAGLYNVHREQLRRAAEKARSEAADKAGTAPKVGR